MTESTLSRFGVSLEKPSPKVHYHVEESVNDSATQEFLLLCGKIMAFCSRIFMRNKYFPVLSAGL